MIYCKQCNKIYYEYYRAPVKIIIEKVDRFTDYYTFTEVRNTDQPHYMCYKNNKHDVVVLVNYNRIKKTEVALLENMRKGSNMQYIDLEKLTAADFLFVVTTLRLQEEIKNMNRG